VEFGYFMLSDNPTTYPDNELDVLTVSDCGLASRSLSASVRKGARAGRGVLRMFCSLPLFTVRSRRRH
jgi:hypothetical protein